MLGGVGASARNGGGYPISSILLSRVVSSKLKSVKLAILGGQSVSQQFGIPGIVRNRVVVPSCD